MTLLFYDMLIFSGQLLLFSGQICNLNHYFLEVKLYKQSYYNAVATIKYPNLLT